MTRGEYGFRTPDGCLHVVTYETHPTRGYRVLGSNKKECGHDSKFGINYVIF